MDLMTRRRSMMGQSQLIPNNYIRVIKLISIGTDSSFPYINTGIIPTSSYGFDVICESYSLYNDNIGSYGCIFGGRVSSGTQDFQVTTFTNNQYVNQGTMRWGNSTDNSLNGSISLNTRTRLKMSNNEYFVDGIKIGEIHSYVSGGVPICLFGLNNNGSLVQHGRGCAIYRATFFDADGVTVADFFPIVRKNDSKPGMYDTVSKQFFTNQNQTSEEFRTQ